MARLFNFSLQKVLDVRQHAEEQKSLDLSKAQKELLEEKRRLSALKEKKEEALETAATEEKVSVTDLRVKKDYLLQINTALHAQHQRVKKSDQKVEKQREKLIEAVKEKKVVETLKEHQLEEYRRMKNLAETKQIDDVALRTSQRAKEE
jgi:flagellar FliJ protein